MTDTSRQNSGSDVRVRCTHSPERGYEFQVRLRSRKRSGNVTVGTVPADSTDKTRKAVQLMAGAVAERQCEQYRDTHNPSEVARAAAEAFDEVVSSLRADRRVKTEHPGLIAFMT